MPWIATAALVAWLIGGPVDPVARANFPNLLVEFGEGSVTYLYLDQADPPNVTIGRGNMLPTLGDALALDWSGASAQAVQAAWLRVKSHPELAKDGGGAFASLTTIRATQTSIDALIGSRLNEIDAVARAEWPGWDAAPPLKQEGLARIMWACGPRIAPGPGRDPTKTWPKLRAAWIARDRAACAAECRIPSLDRTEPGANDREAQLFEADDGWGEPADTDPPPTEPAPT